MPLISDPLEPKEVQRAFGLQGFAGGALPAAFAAAAALLALRVSAAAWAILP